MRLTLLKAYSVEYLIKTKTSTEFLTVKIEFEHFDYASSAWYPNVHNKFKSKLQIVLVLN